MFVETEFILFTHYNQAEKADWEAYRNGTLKAVAGVESLSQFLEPLLDLLQGKRKGILVLFYDAGWLEALGQIRGGGFLDRKALTALEFGETFKAQLLQAIKARGLDGLPARLRIVTAKSLWEFFEVTEWDLASHFDSWFIGESLKLTYDSPKLVDAVIRLRMLDSGLPVFRIDQDVLFNENSGREAALGLAEAVDSSIRLAEKLRNEPRINYAMASCRYRASDVCQPNAGLSAWGSAFATRVYPALLADELASAPGELERAFDLGLAQRFYGLDENNQFLYHCGVWRIGAHPLRAVVSGGLLYMSPGAILDLPPFSNLDFQVMWIDDHLKYLLHRSLGHFVDFPEDPWDGVRPEVRKGRPQRHGDPVEYVYGEYLPTVFWGTIVDAWIQQNPHVKLSTEELERFTQRGRLRGVPGPLAEELRFALRTGQLDGRSRKRLYQGLRETAAERIWAVYQEWSALQKDGRDSCACRWVKGTTGREGLAAGLVPAGIELEGGTGDGNLDRLNEPVRNCLNELVVQAIGYIDWTLNWPRIVQTIRAIPPGRFAGDLEPRPRG